MKQARIDGTVAELIKQGGLKLLEGKVAASSREAMLEAEILMSYVLNEDRTAIISKGGGMSVSDEIYGRYMAFISRRIKRIPVAYITGEAEFMGLRFKVDESVLIPRPETELLAEKTIEVIRKRVAAPGGAGRINVFEPCTGCGNLCVSLARILSRENITDFMVYASDLSHRAVGLALENARENGVTGFIKFFQGDLFGPLESLNLKGKIDIILSNPPYVRTGEQASLGGEVRQEPWPALCGGEDGLDFYRKIFSAAPGFLKKGGCILLENGWGQAGAVKSIAASTRGMVYEETYADLSGIERVTAAVRE